MEVKGICAQACIENDNLIIKKLGMPEKIIPISQITAIQFKEPAFLNKGFIAFIYAGMIEKNIKNYQQAVKEDNAIVFGKKELNDFLNLKKRIEDRNNEKADNYTDENIPEQIKKLSELKDNGILTEEEFINKKTELLSRM